MVVILVYGVRIHEMSYRNPDGTEFPLPGKITLVNTSDKLTSIALTYFKKDILKEGHLNE